MSSCCAWPTDVHTVFLVGREPLRYRSDRVAASRQALEFVNSLIVGNDRNRPSIGGIRHYCRLGNDCAGGVGDTATQGPGRCLGGGNPCHSRYQRDEQEKARYCERPLNGFSLPPKVGRSLSLGRYPPPSGIL